MCEDCAQQGNDAAADMIRDLLREGMEPRRAAALMLREIFRLRVESAILGIGEHEWLGGFARACIFLRNLYGQDS